jgi:hypothetical protein
VSPKASPRHSIPKVPVNESKQFTFSPSPKIEEQHNEESESDGMQSEIEIDANEMTNHILEELLN